MMISREKKTRLRSNSISNQGRLGWFSGRSKGKKRPVGECKFFRAWPLCRGSVSETKANDTRIFSPLAVAGLWVTIGRYWYLFKRLSETETFIGDTRSD